MTDPAPAFDAEKLLGMACATGHNAALGLRYAAHGADWCELALDYRHDLVGQPATGILASGPILALMDMTAGSAAWIRRDKVVPLATLDLRIDYLRAAVPGRTVIGHAQCYRLTRRIAFVRGHAHDGDPADPLAHVAATFMLTDAA